MKIEVGISRVHQEKAQASVHVSLDKRSGFTISDILVSVQEGKGKISMPLSVNRRPCVTVQGELKQNIQKAVQEAYLTALWDPSGRAQTTVEC